MVSCNACRGLVCDACAVRIARGETVPALEAELQRVTAEKHYGCRRELESRKDGGR